MIPTIVKTLAAPISDLLSEFIEDKDKRNEIAFKIASQSHETTMAQIEVNKAEAAHKSIFVAGWRPGAGWLCILILANNYLLLPYSGAMGLSIQPLDAGAIMPVLLGMLGLVGARTREKEKGVAREK